MRRISSAVALVAVLASGSAACRDRAGNSGVAAPTTVSSGAAQSPTSAVPETGPVTEADAVEVDDVLRRLDGELDRLDSDMAGGEGDLPEHRLEAAKAVASGAATRRLLALRTLAAFAEGISRIGERDRGTRTDQLQSQVDGLTTLNAKIQGAVDPATIRADASRMVTDYRVYALTIPKARGIFATDLELRAAHRFLMLADRLNATVSQAQAKGKDTAKPVADLTSLRNSIAAVSDAVSPLPAALLALQPSGYPGTQGVLEQARLALRTGRARLADAARLVRQLIVALK